MLSVGLLFDLVDGRFEPVSLLGEMLTLQRGQVTEAQVGPDLGEAGLPGREVVLADAGVPAALRLAAADDRSSGGGALYVAQAQSRVRVEKAVGERSDEQVAGHASQHGLPPSVVDHSKR